MNTKLTERRNASRTVSSRLLSPGDNRLEIAGLAGRRSLALNRTATFVFVLGSRFFGA